MNDSDRGLLEQLRIEPSQREKTGHRWLWLALAVLVVLGAGVGYYAYAHRPISVQTAAAKPPPSDTNRVPVLDATGYVTARLEATVSSQITGKLADVYIEEGDQVKKGQVLARLDDADAKAQLKLAHSQLDAAKAQLGSLEVQLKQARRDLNRQQQLQKRGLGTDQALDDAQTKVHSLAAQLNAQREQVKVARAQLDISQVNFDNTIVRAPFSGVIIAKAAQPGEIVSPMSAGGGYTRTGIGTIVDMDSLEVEVDVNEAYINRVKAGQPVTAVLDAYPDWKIPGHVIAIIPTADRSKATVRVRVALDQKDPRILPDMGLRVSFYEGDKGQGRGSDQRAAPAGGALVPASAIIERNGHSLVFLVDDQRVRLQRVVSGQTYGDLRLVQSGVKVGQQVVRDPPANLRDGARVKVSPTAGDGS